MNLPTAVANGYLLTVPNTAAHWHFYEKINKKPHTGIQHEDDLDTSHRDAFINS
ncbi:MAG: hypothetical protein K0R59_3877 [Sphingobacterium sp.]|jgi:hypothetical protein|uniref:hypothetical protein n=1 Tax=unclassified Sphingobacterium TaxID=2609468 RepID=UPI001589817F|nr:hypothetical protein [Sphingobacterium sp. CZ-UAM]MDF2518581.1 hypothetical protein [Sphingobacterium sp.]